MIASSRTSTSTTASSRFDVVAFLLLLLSLCTVGDAASLSSRRWRNLIPSSSSSSSKEETKTTTATASSTKKRMNTHHNFASLLLQRILAIGDFDGVNDVINHLEFTMPDPESVEQTGVRVEISNIVCGNLYVGDVDIQWTKQEQQDDTGGNTDSSNQQQEDISAVEIPATLDAIAIDITCAADYQYFIFGFPTGQGTAQILTSNNDVFSSAILKALNNSQTPTNMEIVSCTSSVNVEDLEFAGQGLDLAGTFLNTVEFLFRGIVADVIEDLLCQLVLDSDQALDGFLGSINDALNPYLEGPPLEQDLGSQDPLELEAAATAYLDPNNNTLLDYQNPTSPLATVGVTMVKGYGESLGQIVDDDGDGSATGELQMNEIVREFTPDTPGVLEYDVPADVDGTLTLVEGIDFQIKRITLRGLDRFTNVSFYTIGNYTWQGNISHEGAEIQVEADLAIRAIEEDKELIESITMVVPVGPIEATVSVLALLDMAEVGQLPLGALMNMNDTIACVLSTLELAQVSHMEVSPLDLGMPIMSGFASPGLERMTRSMVELLYTGFLPSIAPAADRFLHTTVLDTIEDLWRTAVCPDRPYTEKGTVDVRDLLLAPAEARALGASGDSPYGGLMVLAKDWLDEELKAATKTTNDQGEETGSSLLNALFEQGSFQFPNNVLNISEPIWDEALHLDLQLRDIMIENIDSLGDPIALADPMDGQAHRLRNMATFGLPPKPLHLNLTIDLLIQNEQEEIHNIIFVDALLETSSIVADLLVRLSEQKLFRLPVDAILDFPCILSTFHTPRLDATGVRLEGEPASLSFAEFELLVGSFTFNVSCVDCDSPELYQMSELLQRPGARDEASQELRNLFNFLFSFVEGDRSLVQGILDRAMVDASRTCPYSTDYDPAADPVEYSLVTKENDISSWSYLGAMLAVIAGIALVGVATAVFVRWVVARRNRTWLATLPPENLLTIYRAQVYQRERDAETNAMSSSIFASDQVPFFAKYFVPVMILGNIALFLSGHLSEGGAVRVYISLAGKELVVDDLYTFAVAPTVLNLWRSGAQALSAIMFVASIAWPYLKQLMTLFSWFMPPDRLPLSRRGSILLWLDFLGKFSILDVFVLMGALVAFRLTVTSPQRIFLPEGLYEIDLIVALRWGLYANMIAQVISQIGSHFIIHYHRRVEEAALAQYAAKHTSVTSTGKAMQLQATMETSEPNAFHDPNRSFDEGEDIGAVEENLPREKSPSLSSASLAASGVEVVPRTDQVSFDEKERLHQTVFRRPHRVECSGLRARKSVNAFVIALALSIVALVFLGCTLDSFSTEVQGLVGMVQAAGKDSAQPYQSYSVFDVVKALWDQTELDDSVKNKIGIIAVCALAVYTTVVTPIGLTVALLLQWFYPFSGVGSNRLAVAIEVLEAWQYLEVYILSLVVGVWQLGSISEAMGDAYCLAFQNTLSQLAFYGVVDSSDANCLRIQSTLDSATYILIAAVVLLALLRAFVVLAFRQVRFQKNGDETMQRVASMDQKVLSEDEQALSIKDVKPLPVLFSDRFRWFLESA